MKRYESWYGCIYKQIMKPLGVYIHFSDLKRYMITSISPKQAFSKWLASQQPDIQLHILQQLLIHKPKSKYLKSYLRLIRGDKK